MKRRAGRDRRIALLRNRAVPAVLTAAATSVLMAILYYVNFDLLYGGGASAIIFASFGSSAFLMFTMPKLGSARISSFVKSYVLAAVIGEAGFYMAMALPSYAVAGVVVLAVSLLMYAVGGPHPPAIGIALAFVLFRIDAYGLLIVLMGIAILVFLRIVLERFIYAGSSGSKRRRGVISGRRT